jgi:hypothetical protein
MHNDFPIPKVPQPFSTQPTLPTIDSPTQSSSETRLLENGLPQPPPPRPLPPVPAFDSSATSTPRVPESLPPSQPLSADSFPDLLIQQFNYITQTLRTCFSEKPPHTIQRLAELVLSPTKHYKTLPAWLRAVDRVISVSSTADIFPLPHAQPLPGSVIDSTLANGVNGVGSGTGGGGILWTNSDSRNGYDAGLGSDESLGGALLTPIPWLKNGVNTSGSTDMSSPRSDPLSDPIETEGHPMVPERKDGAVTQGELIRQEQEAGIVPVSQTMGLGSSHMSSEAEDGELDDSEALPHARGPDIVGAADIGLQDGRNMEVSIGGHADAQVDQVRVDEAGKPADVDMKAEDEADDEDIVLTDVDGKTDEQADEKADASGENVGPDAADTSAV